MLSLLADWSEFHIAMLDNLPSKWEAELLKPLILSKIKSPDLVVVPHETPFLYIVIKLELFLVINKCCHLFKVQLVGLYTPVLDPAILIFIIVDPLNSIL